MKKLFYIFPLFAVLLMAACEEELPETMGGIYGIVSNLETGEPVRGASVILSPGNQTTVTGYDGHFEFSNLEAGQYKLQASASGYNTNSRQITVIAGKDASGDMPLAPIAEVMNVRLSNNYFEFGAEHTELALTIQNTGNSGSIDWTITGVDAAWLTVSPLSGSIAMGKTADVKLVVNRDKLATDEASTTFMVNAAGGSQSVRVNVTKKSAGGNDDDNDDNNGNSNVQDVTGGLYAYYTFEENVKNQVEDGAPNATAVNAPTYVDGLNGTKAIKFNVNDNSFISISEAMINYGTFSVSFWVRNLGDGHIFHIESGNYARYILGMTGGFFTFNLYGRDYGRWTGNTFAHESLEYSAWSMITLTSTCSNGSRHELKLYINGEHVDLCTLTDATAECEKFVFGGKYYDDWQTSNMIIDNLRIYDTRALNAQEVERIYNYEKE